MHYPLFPPTLPPIPQRDLLLSRMYTELTDLGASLVLESNHLLAKLCPPLSHAERETRVRHDGGATHRRIRPRRLARQNARYQADLQDGRQDVEQHRRQRVLDRSACDPNFLDMQYENKPQKSGEQTKPKIVC